MPVGDCNGAVVYDYVYDDGRPSNSSIVKILNDEKQSLPADKQPENGPRTPRRPLSHSLARWPQMKGHPQTTSVSALMQSLSVTPRGANREPVPPESIPRNHRPYSRLGRYLNVEVRLVERGRESGVSQPTLFR